MAIKKKETQGKQKDKSWFKDKYQFVLVQRNILAVITLISLLAAVLCAFAMQRLAPLKSVEPFIIQIDQKSGITEMVQPMTRERLKSPDQLDDFFLWRYVVARETYDTADRDFRLETVRVLSAPKVFDIFTKEIAPSNDSSAAHTLGDFGTRKVENPTITHLEGTEKAMLAQVRFAIRERFRNSESVYFMLATVEYSYNEIVLTRDERLINPLGFQVKSFRLDDETVKKTQG